MISFEGGPADGQTLALTSCPAFLRVVQDSAGQLAALDLETDEPEADETVFVYRLATYAAVHVKGSKEVRGWHVRATYQLSEPQSEAEHVRDLTAWAEWCKTQPIGPARAAKLEALVKGLGVLDPLRFSHSWCGWQHAALAQLTEAEGLRLIDEAKTSIRQLGVPAPKTPAAEPAEPGNVYQVPAGAVFKPCRACRTPITFIKTETGADLPVAREGVNHYTNCTDPKRFSRSAKREGAAT